MSIDAATNCWTSNEDAFKSALPELAAFQSFLGVANAADASSKVFMDSLPKPWDEDAYSAENMAQIGSYALVTSSPEGGYEITLTESGSYEPSGRVAIEFEKLVTGPEEQTQDSELKNTEQVERVFKNHIGSLMRQLVDYMKQNGGPWITKVKVLEGPYHNVKEVRTTYGHRVGLQMEITWGFGQ